jgi:protein TonB
MRRAASLGLESGSGTEATDRATAGLPRAVLFVSLGFHLAAFLIAFGVPRLMASAPPSGPVYIVDLVSPPGGPAGPPAAPAPQPQQAPAPPPPAAAPKTKPIEKAVVKPPPKPTEKAIVIPDRDAKKRKPTKPEPKVEATAATTAPTKAAAPETPAQQKPETAAPPVTTGAPGGTGTGAGAGGAGQGTGGGGDDYTFYLSLLDHSIRGAWIRPVYTGRETRSATVRLQLNRTGGVLRLELAVKSGFEPLDRSVLRAVKDAQPFPPFPTSLSLDTLSVQIVFDLTPEGTEPGN